MRLHGREISPTRAQALALRDEQRLIREGYEFLDEKRMLLAAELLKQLDAYRAAKARFDEAQVAARGGLVDASGRHGFEELTVYPAPPGGGGRVTAAVSNFLGIPLVEASLEDLSTTDLSKAELEALAYQPVFSSAEAEGCKAAFQALLRAGVVLAGITQNLHRLARDYRATERRARALENVLLPETRAAVKQIDEHLETAEQEEALLVRHAKGAL